MRDAMLRAGLSGLGLAIVFHEIEQGVRVLYEAIEAGTEGKLVRDRARELVRILDGFSELLRKGESKKNSLVPSASRRTGTYPAALDTQLSRLAVAAVGEKNVPNDKRAALNAALTPILGDRIQNQTVTAAMKTIWDSAVTKDQDPNH